MRAPDNNARKSQALRLIGAEKKELLEKTKQDLLKKVERLAVVVKQYNAKVRKGSMQRLAPFKPQDPGHRPAEHEEEAIAQWQGEANEPIGEYRSPRRLREDIPHMEGSVRKRALHKLHGATEVRRAKDGKREFLLHRGSSSSEKNKAVKDDTVNHKIRSSWTPHKVIAGYHGTQQGGGTTSAWVHEDKIIHVPKQLGALDVEASTKWDEADIPKGKNAFYHEHEVIVDSGHKSKLHKSLKTEIKKKLYELRDELKKELYGNTHMKEAHGWISPKGKFHQMNSRDKHEFATEIFGHKYYPDAYKEGWVAIGHSGKAHLSGKKEILHDYKSPQMQTARQIGKKYFISDKTTLSPTNDEKYNYYEVPTEHWLKHGTIKPEHKVAPSGDNDDFGKKELDPKEGYRILTAYKGTMHSNVTAYDKEGKVAGRASFQTHPNHTFKPVEVEIHPEHRRKGLASAMYQHIEGETGRKLNPSLTQTNEGKKLWTQKDRKFGKSKEFKKRDLDPKEGYKFKYAKVKGKSAIHQTPFDRHVVTAHSKEGEQVARAEFRDETGGKHITAFDAWVEKPHRRKGVASAMYQFAEKKTNKIAKPSGALLTEGKRFWDQKERKFGKNEGLKTEHHYTTKAKKHFGTTHNIKEAGYINSDGSLLDFSGRHHATDHPSLKGQRRVDHRELPDALRGPHESPTSGMYHFMKESGSIRHHPETGGLEVIKKPTNEQVKAIAHHYEFSKEPLHVDKVHPGTNLLEGSSKVHNPTYNKLKNHFNNVFSGKTPKPSKIAEFHKSDDEYTHLVHYSPNKLSEIHPKHHGKGVKGADRGYKGESDYHPRSYYYTKGTTPEHLVAASTKYKHHAKVETKHIYDAGKDEHNYSKQVRDKNQGVFRMPAFESKVKQSGFKGYKVDNVVAMFEPVKPHSVEEHKDRPIKKSDLRKEMWQRNPTERKMAEKYHGWISPKGEFHSMPSDKAHNDFARDKLKEMGIEHNQVHSMATHVEKLVGLGWLRSGLSGTKSVHGKASVLHDANHPATKKLTNLMRDVDTAEPMRVFTDQEAGAVYNVPHRMVRAGNFRQPSKVAEFHKAVQKTDLFKKDEQSVFPNKYSIITAENPMHKPSDKGGNKALESKLKAKGYKYESVSGKYSDSGKVERGFLVHHADPKHINQLGAEHGQDSVIHSEGGKHKMHYTGGEKKGQYHAGEGHVIHDKEPKKYYSTIQRKGKKHHFTLHFDFDKLHKSIDDSIKNKLSTLKSLVKEKCPNGQHNVVPEILTKMSLLRSKAVKSTSELKKEGWGQNPTEWKQVVGAHGWINPEGKFHQMTSKDHVHNPWLSHHHGLSSQEAYKKGWLSIGHGGHSSVAGHEDTLLNPNHPATRTARKLISEHHSDKSVSHLMHHKDVKQLTTGDETVTKVPTDHWVKHGTVPKSKIAQFHKNDPIQAVFDFDGISAKIEWPKGSIRAYKDGYSKKMQASYGYLEDVMGDDGEELDVYIGSTPASKRVFMITQVKKKTGKYDEKKVMLHYNSPEEAKESYSYHMPDRPIGGIEEISLARLTEMVNRKDKDRLQGEEKPDGERHIVRKGNELRKYSWNIKPELKEEVAKFHGWVSPEGKFHALKSGQFHAKAGIEHVKRYYPKDKIDYADNILHDKGWVSVGGAGELNVTGNSKVLGDRNHPAVKKISGIIKDLKSHKHFKNVEVYHHDTDKMHHVPRALAEKKQFSEPSKMQRYMYGMNKTIKNQLKYFRNLLEVSE